MRIVPIVCLMVSMALTAPRSEARAEPRFQDFPAKVEAVKQVAPPKIADRQSREFATRIKEASHNKPNFAGHYILANWGCGASCITTVVIDAKTGALIWLPFTVCCWSLNVTDPLEFKLESRLLVISGSRNEAGSGKYFYEFNGAGFRLIEAEEEK